MKFVTHVQEIDLWKISVNAQLKLLMMVQKFAHHVETSVKSVLITKTIVLFVKNH